MSEILHTGELIKEVGAQMMKLRWKKQLLLVPLLLMALVPSFALASQAVAAEDDYTLGVYGNANADGVIDARDITFAEKIILGLEEPDELELADANLDGKIDMLDVTQIELIILGKETQLTVLIYAKSGDESSNVPVTINKPLARIVPCSANHIIVMRALKMDADMVVGVRSEVPQASSFFSEFQDRTDIGTGFPIDYEAILALAPDLVTIWANGYQEDADNLGVTAVGFDFSNPDTYVDEVRRFSYIIDKEDEAEEFIEFYSGVLNTIAERISGIADEDKPTVYYESKFAYNTSGAGTSGNSKITIPGGYNIFGDQEGYFEVDPEAVIMANPDIIVKFPRVYKTYGDYYEGSDLEDMAAAWDEIMNRAELAEVEAIKNGQVYLLDGDVIGACRDFLGMTILAKWFYPDLFADIDPVALHIEYLTRFQGLPEDYLDGQDGVFAYPPLE